jgi:hypothetical protein
MLVWLVLVTFFFTFYCSFFMGGFYLMCFTYIMYPGLSDVSFAVCTVCFDMLPNV